MDQASGEDHAASIVDPVYLRMSYHRMSEMSETSNSQTALSSTVFSFAAED